MTRSKSRIQRATPIKIIIFLLFFILAGSPVLIILFQTAARLLSGNTELLSLALPSGRRLDLWMETIGFSACVALGGMLVSLSGGSLLYQFRGRIGYYMKFSVLAFSVVPSYVHAMAWNNAFLELNRLLTHIGIPFAVPLQGFAISAFVQMMSLLPFGTGMVLLGLEFIDHTLVEAGKLLSDDLHVLTKIIFPLIFPSVAAGSAFMLLMSMMDYTIPSLFQINLYSLEIFSQYSANYDHAAALMLSLPMLLITIPVALLFQSAFRSLPLTATARDIGASSSFCLPAWLKVLQYIGLGILMLEIIIPVASLVASMGSVVKLPAIITGSGQEIINTIFIAFFAALLALPFILAAASGIHHGGRLSKLWWGLLIMPLTLPAPLIGIGLISVWNGGMLSLLYGTAFMPIAVGLIRFLPFSAIILLVGMKRVDPLLFDAASVLQKNRWQTLFFVKIPTYSKALIAACGVMFILTAGELGATLLVIPPGMGILTLKIYNYMHYGKSDAVSALCMLMLLLSLAAGAIVMGMLYQKNTQKE